MFAFAVSCGCVWNRGSKLKTGSVQICYIVLVKIGAADSHCHWSRGPEPVGNRSLCYLPGISKHIINKLRAPGSSAAPCTGKAIFLSFFFLCIFLKSPGELALVLTLMFQAETALTLVEKYKKRNPAQTISAKDVKSFCFISTFCLVRQKAATMN